MSVWIFAPLTAEERKTWAEEMEKERKMLEDEGIILAEKKGNIKAITLALLSYFGYNK